MTEQFIRGVFFPLIRTGLGLEEAPIAIDESDAEQAGRLSAGQAILPIVLAGLEKQGVPRAWLRELDRERMNCVYRHVVRDDALRKIGGALNAAAIPFILLKGAVLKDLYPEPWMRTSSDLDVLVREEDLDRAVAAIEGAAGFKFDKRNYHDVTMLSAQLCLELHFSIKENMPGIDALLERVWDYARPVESGYEMRLTPEFQLFHVLAHMSYHMVHGGLGVRPFLDLWLLQKKTAYDENTLRGMCASCGILTFYETACALLRAWMEGAAHTEVTAVLETYCLDGGVFGSADNGAAQREHRGLSYILHRLFVNREVLEGMYPGLRGKAWQMPLFQVRRWLRLLDRGKRRGALAEVKRMSAADKTAIESFDALLKTLGL